MNTTRKRQKSRIAKIGGARKTGKRQEIEQEGMFAEEIETRRHNELEREQREQKGMFDEEKKTRRHNEELDQERRIQELEDKLNKKYQLLEEKKELLNKTEQQRVSRSSIGEKISFEMLKNREYFPKMGNEVSIEYNFTNGDTDTFIGIVTDVNPTEFKVLEYETGKLLNIANFIKYNRGYCTITKEKPDSSGDCLDSFRPDARDFILSDFSDYEIISILDNPYAKAGNPFFDVFCQFLKKDYPVILAYHGTSRQNVKPILKSNIERATIAYYGAGAYFTTNPAKAYDYGSDRRSFGYEKDPAVRDIIVCALSLNPSHYDFSDTSREVDEIVNSNTFSHIPLFHLRIRLKKLQWYQIELPKNPETFLFDLKNEKTKVLANYSTKKIRN